MEISKEFREFIKNEEVQNIINNNNFDNIYQGCRAYDINIEEIVLVFKEANINIDWDKYILKEALSEKTMSWFSQTVLLYIAFKNPKIANDVFFDLEDFNKIKTRYFGLYNPSKYSLTGDLKDDIMDYIADAIKEYGSKLIW